MSHDLRAFSVGATIAMAAMFLATAMQQPGFAGDDGHGAGKLRIGWASTDITPEGPAAMSGGSRARISTGVMDPLTATALVLESEGDGTAAERIVLVSVDWGSVHADVLESVRKKLSQRLPEIEPDHIIMFGTHTHAAPERRTAPDLVENFKKLGIDVLLAWSWWGMDLGVTPSPLEYAEMASGRIADAIEQAWKNRKPGGVSFGLGQAVVGHNRLTAYGDGRSEIYGPTDRPDFSHVEAGEDHSVNLLYTWDAQGKLTGVAVNIACPAQVSEGGSQFTADYWHETRKELRKWLGINDGDRLVSLTATMTAPRGLRQFAVKKFGSDSPQAKIDFKSGDVSTTTLRTAKGKMIRIDCGLSSTRPYSRYYLLQGLKGCYDSRAGVYLSDEVGEGEWQGNLVAKYAAKYEHEFYRKEGEEASKAGGGHGSIDYFVVREFVKMVRENNAPWIDVYDAAAWTSIMHLSRQSIDKNGDSVAIPDFTGGRWKDPDWRKGRMA